MTNDIVALIDYYEKEKGIDRDKVVAALEYAFISAYRKMVPGADAIEVLRADVNTKKGETRIFASLTVVPDEEQTDKFNQVAMKIATRRKADAQPGDILEFDVTPKDFGRIAVQTAKQTTCVVSACPCRCADRASIHHCGLLPTPRIRTAFRRDRGLSLVSTMAPRKPLGRSRRSLDFSLARLYQRKPHSPNCF